jgi:hypothetical protein
MPGVNQQRHGHEQHAAQRREQGAIILVLGPLAVLVGMVKLTRSGTATRRHAAPVAA